MNKLFTKIAAILSATMAVGVGVAAVSAKSKEASPVQASTISSGTTTYTFTSAKWAATGGSGNWTSGKDGGGFSNSGIQVTTTYSGANATSPDTFQNVEQIVLTYHTNKSKGAGTAVVQVGSNTEVSKAWSKPSSGDGTTTDQTLTYDFSPTQSGTIKITLNTTTNSIYLMSCAVTCASQSQKTLSSITVSEDHRSFTVGDTFVKETVTAHYSDSSTADVTSSATFSGYSMSTAGNQTVNVSYSDSYGSANTSYSITVSAPSTPFITPAKASTSGYTGQNESLSFTYGNLTGSLSVTSSNTSVVTVGTPSTSAGSGSVQINFVAEGSTTVKFKDGSTELASVSVSVSDPTVTITGMPSARSIATGETLNLGSLITVTPSGNLSSDVTWSTSNSSFASVTQSGVVTGGAVGSATITVTPDDYPAGAVSCTVTVANVMTAVFGTTRSNSGTEITDASKYKTDYSYTIDTNITLSAISKVYPQTSNALKFGSSSAVGSMTFSIPSTIDSKPVYITSVTVRAERHHATNGTTMLIGDVEKVLTYSADDYTADLSNGEVTSFVLTADSSSSDKRMYVQSVSIQYAFKKTLSSIALSGSYQTTFTKGGTFNHDGLVVTATYSDSSTADVTSSATFSGYDLSNTGNQTVTVSYTEGTTKTATYPITVNYAAVTSVTLSQNSAEIGLGETFNYTQVTVTVSPSTANPAVTWSVVTESTTATGYTFNGSGLTAGQVEGIVTLKCASDADSSKYATLVVTITGDPTAEFDKASTSGYAGKSEIISFAYGNMDDVSKITVASSNTSYVSVANDLLADEGVGLVTINFVAEGSANVTISYDGGETLDTLTVTVSADGVKSVTWSASNFDVFSGTELTSAIDNTWLVGYEMDSGDEGLLEYGEYTLKLGGTAITLPHTWAAADSGKTLCVEYGGVSSSTVSVTVTQTINAVYAPNTSSNTVSWTASEAADLGAKIGSEGETDEGNISTGTYEWDYTRTLTSLTSGKSDNISFQGETWIQLGSNNSMESLELTTSAIPGTIKSISVVVATAGSHVLTIDVGGTKYLENEELHVYSGTAAAANPDPADCVETGTGSSSGAITITIAPTAATKKAMVIRSISVTYETGGSGTTNIANDPAHKVDQRAAVAFANTFNGLVDEYGLCSKNATEGATGWAAIESAYNSFMGSASDWAKNLITYASEQYTGNVDNNDCIERMRQTYAILCGRNYSEIMSGLITIGSPRIVQPLSLISNNGSEIAITVVVSMIGLSAVGGYFFLRKRKEI